MSKQFLIADALLSLCPGAEWSISDNEYTKIVWHSTDIEQPTEQEISQEIARLQLDYENKQYQRERASNYPDIKEQLDMIWHAIDSGELDRNSNFYLALKSVKDSYPKG